MKLVTYANYKGKCQEAFRYYEKHLGGKITSMVFHTGEAENVLHARIQIGDTQLLGADVPTAQPMRSAYLTLMPDSVEEAERIYAALADGGEVFMPIQETFFAFRFGQLRDQFGANWMILHERPQPQPQP